MNRTALLFFITLLLSAPVHAAQWVEGHFDDNGIWMDAHLEDDTDDSGNAGKTGNSTTPGGVSYNHYHVDPVGGASYMMAHVEPAKKSFGSGRRNDLGAMAGADTSFERKKKKYQFGGQLQPDDSNPEWMGPPSYYVEHQLEEEMARKEEVQVVDPNEATSDAGGYPPRTNNPATGFDAFGNPKLNPDSNSGGTGASSPPPW